MPQPHNVDVEQEMYPILFCGRKHQICRVIYFDRFFLSSENEYEPQNVSIIILNELSGKILPKTLKIIEMIECFSES